MGSLRLVVLERETQRGKWGKGGLDCLSGAAMIILSSFFGISQLFFFFTIKLNLLIICI